MLSRRKPIDFWRGEAGDEYIARNQANMAARITMWRKIISTLPVPPKSVLEVGANIGQNIMALDAIISDLEPYAVEPNQRAAELLSLCGLMPPECVHNATADRMPFEDASIDCVFTSGVLIHIPPELLLMSMREMFRISKRYIICAEYFSAEPEEKAYRGESELLWKRDFGALWLDEFDVRIISYAFEWKRATGLDNLTWWAFEKV